MIGHPRCGAGLLCGILLSLAVSACSSRGGATAGVVTRDSAGIRIIESSAPLFPAGSGWTVSPQPVVEIGANDKDTTQILHQVEAAVRLTDGRIVIADGGTPTLRWYDAKGAFLHGTGRYGQGPGEFDGGEGSAWIYTIWALTGDSVGTWEHSRRRMQVFDPQGRYARAVVIDLPPDMPPAAYPQISGRLGSGFVAFLLDERAEDGPLGVVYRDSVWFLRYSGDGRFAQRIARLPALVRFIGEIRSTMSGQMLRGPMVPPFAPPFASWTEGDRLYYGGAERYEISAYDTAGVLRALVRRLGARRPVTPEMIQSFRESRLRSAGTDPARRRAAEEGLEKLKYPDSLPAYRRLRADREGMLWVQEYVPPGASSATWSVFDRDGRWITDVTVPTSWQIQDIGRDYILTLETGELDVELVRMYRLVRGRE